MFRGRDDNIKMGLKSNMGRCGLDYSGSTLGNSGGLL
jgi:hypothetical protein